MSITLIISIFFLVIAIWLFNFHETKIINLLLVKPFTKTSSNLDHVRGGLDHVSGGLDHVSCGCECKGEVGYKSYESSHSYHTIVKRNTIKYFGKATLPKKVILSDSRSISINLKSDISEFFIKQPKNKNVEHEYILQDFLLDIPMDDTSNQFLEIELQAAGLSVDGMKTQCQRLTLTNLSYYWNCYFPNLGNHEINFIIRYIKNEKITVLGRISHEIKVLHLDHLTGHQVRAAGLISVCLSFTLILYQLGVLEKIFTYIFQ